MKKFAQFDETVDNLLATAKNIKPEKQSYFLPESLGYTLGEDIVAHENSPEFLTASMDGYACRYEDLQKGELQLSDHLPAGSFKENSKVSEGTCIKTFTGALMSQGSDTLIPIENVQVEGDIVKIIEPVTKGFSVREIGENYKIGEVLVPKGTKIGYAEVGVMAELGITQVKVNKAPNIAILATGSEIIELGEPKTSPAQIRSSNHITIEGILKEAGANAKRLPIVKDDKELIKKSILKALQDNDMVITTGGVSVGDYDFVKEILQDIEPEYIIDGAFVKPGRHVKIVKVGKKFICALPGFPYSSAAMTYTYVLPLVRAFLGQDPKPCYIEAYIQEEYQKRSKFTEFTACNLYFQEGKVCVDLAGKRIGSSAILTNMLGDTALLRIEKETKVLAKGDRVRVLPMTKLL